MSAPSPTGKTPDQAFSAGPGLSLTERRKAETRMEIARAAAGLFVRQGLRATRAEDIAQAAGIAPRTFYRYFATKEEAIAPLYAACARRWAEAVREAPAALGVPEALEHAVHHTLTPGVGVSAASWEWVRTLIRLAHSSPGLRKVWAEVCQGAEQTLAEVLATRAASDSAPSAQGSAASETPAAGDDNVGAEAPVTPELRFTAAVASAAVRVAVESWASGSATASGAEGPAALALRNLEALRGFSWGVGTGSGRRKGRRNRL
ncbi:TetR/AcrR family transcriptional regulator [Streptomyces brasiliensis]|uniref:TetR family transcriptional regulator n=1 Tax=Streptomyces brasiliensis TaxID=1954 RepID=A0A917NS32_9ACTN|nr:TetR family transcriptional regulator [Streptomyces brasiliensis]GGJ23278.1 TetR family transcriptional regulator [Streptomyces brasiliensis]